MASMTEKPETLDGVSVEDFLARMPEGMGRLNEKMGIEISEISAQRIVGTMPVEGNTQPYGLLHGGASVVLAETLGSIGSALHAHPDRLSVGVDINATHHRAATSGHGDRRGHGHPPGPDDGLLRGRRQRRTRQAGVHVADHLRAGPGVAGEVDLTDARSRRRMRRLARTRSSCLLPRVVPGRWAFSLARTAWVGATRRITWGPSPRRARNRFPSRDY